MAPAELTRREDLVRAGGVRRPVGPAGAVRVGVTGTGPSLVVLSWSSAELARERVAGVRLLQRFGLRAGMRIGNTLPGALATPGALLLGDVVEELGGLDVPLGAVDGDAAARAAWELFDRVQPDVVVVADGAFLAAAPPAARPWWHGIVQLRTTPVAVDPTVPAAAGFSGWRRTWLAVPEATSFVAGSCDAARFHVDERVQAEVVDALGGRPLPPGERGTLVLTPLDVDGPPVRYASELSGRIAATPCPCGAAGVTLELP